MPEFCFYAQYTRDAENLRQNRSYLYHLSQLTVDLQIISSNWPSVKFQLLNSVLA